MTTDEVRTHLGVTMRTLYRFVDLDGLPAYKMGRVIRFRRGDVEAWLETRRVKPGELSHLYPHDTDTG
jgi:excisionase family DNA binding protein